MAVRAAPPPELPSASLARTVDADATPAEPGPRPQVTQRLGRFTVLRLLGEGGMGQVFAAYDEQLDRRIAVKLLRHARETAGSHLQRVMREAQAMARVAHENVVHVYEVGELSGQIFIAMEFIDGQTLTDWQQHGKRTWQELLAVYRQAAQGLAAAHQTGLVHRDFKPDNVLVDRSGRARVVDFGLARLQGDASVSSELPSGSPQSALQSPISRDGAIAGTPGYMSPEQARGAVVDARSDQFSFCVALYEALYGRAPFARQDMLAALSPGQPLPPPPASAVPIEVFQALSRGLAVEPAARFPAMSQLLAALFPSSAVEGAAAKAARLMVAYVGGVLLVGSSVFLLWKRPASTLRLEDLTRLSVLMFVTLALFAFAMRRKLLTSALNTELVVRLLCFSGTLVCLRYMALFLHLDAQTLLPLDLVVAGGFATSYAYPHLPPVWSVVAGFEVAAGAAARWPQHSTMIGNLAYSLGAFIGYYFWARAARRRGTSKEAS